MSFITVIPVLTFVLLGNPRHADDAKVTSTHLKGVPVTTVEELVTTLRKEGFQWRFIGRQIDFKGTVISESPNLRVRIAGMDKDRLDTAWLHLTSVENSVKKGQQVEVRGLLIDQHYGVWRVWVYTWS